MKRARLLYYVGMISLLAACHNGVKHNYPKDIIGNWKNPRAIRHAMGGYMSFYNNDTVNYYWEFYKRHQEKPDEEYKYEFFGTKARYRFSGDSLFVFDPAEKTWDSLHIFKLNTDTLILGKTGWDTLLKQHYSYDTLPKFDKIVIVGSGGFGTTAWIGADEILSSDGTLLFGGGGMKGIEGFYKAKISVNKFEEIDDNFRRADIKHIKTVFVYPATDQVVIWFTFVKDGRIYKSIRDAGQAGPAEFEAAYPSLWYLYRYIPKLCIDSVKSFQENSIPPWQGFSSGDSVLRLSMSENFLLNEYLMEGKKADTAFNEQFDLSPAELRLNNKLSKGNLTKVTSDGRFYKYYYYQEKPLIIDIGFNFIERNTTVLKFKNADDKN